MIVNLRQNWNIVSREVKGAIFGITAAAATLSITFVVAAVLHDLTDRTDARVPAPVSPVSTPLPPDTSNGTPSNGAVSAQLVRGQALFSQECASCHGDHAQGGFGPDLRRLEMPEAQVAATIKDGIKPEMPAFGRKYGPVEVQAMTVYVKSLHQ